VGGGPRGNGKKAREGLVRACLCDAGVGFDAGRWPEVSGNYRLVMGIALGKRRGRAGLDKMPAEASAPSGDNQKVLPELGMAQMLRKRVRYFTDGAVIGSKLFVNEVFVASRERFTTGRKDGARRLRGNGKAAAGVLWSLRDLRVGIDQ
jgi:hypothetical protein